MNKFNTHDIVTDGTFEGRIDKALDLDGSKTAYDVTFPGGHAPCKEAVKKTADMYAEIVTALTAAQEESQRTQELPEQALEREEERGRIEYEKADVQAAVNVMELALKREDELKTKNAKLREALKEAQNNCSIDNHAGADDYNCAFCNNARAALEA